MLLSKLISDLEDCHEEYGDVEVEFTLDGEQIFYFSIDEPDDAMLFNFTATND